MRDATVKTLRNPVGFALNYFTDKICRISHGRIFAMQDGTRDCFMLAPDLSNRNF